MEASYYGNAGLFTLLVLTLLVFGTIILTFVRWVDNVARLGRMSTTIKKVESAAAEALARRRLAPTMGGTERSLTRVKDSRSLLLDRLHPADRSSQPTGAGRKLLPADRGRLASGVVRAPWQTVAICEIRTP